MLLLSMMTLLHYHITNISRLLSDQSFPTQLGNNLVYFIQRSGSHNLSRRQTSSEWGPSHPQGGDNWSSFLLFRDNWKISISLRLNSTVSSNEPIENTGKYNRLTQDCDFPNKNVNPDGGGGRSVNTYYPNTQDRHEVYYCKLCKLSVWPPHYQRVAILAVSVVKSPTVQTSLYCQAGQPRCNFIISLGADFSNPDNCLVCSEKLNTCVGKLFW